MKHVPVVLAIVALAVGASSACATKKFVRTEVGEVNSKVETLTGQVEQTQQRVTQHEGRIDEVGQRADAAGQAAQAANQNALGAKSAADAAGARAEQIDRAMKRIVYEVTISEDQGNFKFGGSELPDEAKARIDELVNRLKADPKGAYIEIEGHTDSTGPKALNHRLGMERAETVRQYLYETHQIPLHRINVISYGEDKPVAPNKTREGRAQNRRIVIRVLT